MKLSWDNIDEFGMYIHDKIFRSAARYVRLNLWRLEILAVSIAVLTAISRVPYINLVFGIHTLIVLLIVEAIFLLQIKYTHVLYLIVGFLVCALLFTLMGSYAVAEDVGNYIYFLLWIVVFQVMHALWNRQ